MKRCFALRPVCAAVLMSAAALFFAEGAAAQGITRVKARLAAFDGQVLTLQPLAANGMPAGETIAVPVLPQTQYVQQQKSFFGVIKAGDYAGAAVTANRSGRLRAQTVYLYADALRGTGEGRFEDNGRLMINGAVREITPSKPGNQFDGTLTLHYRGATLTGARKNAVCEGRAVAPAFASALACSADALIEVVPGTPVSTLTLADKSVLAPGAMLTVTITRRPDGSQASPGVIVELPQSPP